MKSKNKISSTVYRLGLLSLFNDLTADMITPLLPVFLASLGMGATFLGAVEGFSNAAANITMLFSGWIADRTRKLREMTIFGYALCAFIRPFIAIPFAPLVFAVRVIDRIGKGIRTSPRDRLITSVTPQESWGRAFGVQRSLDHTGSLLAPLCAMAILSVFPGLSLSKLFLVATLPSILAIMILPRHIDEGRKEVIKTPTPLSWKVLPRSLKIYVVLIFFSAFTTPSELFLILKMQQLGVDIRWNPLVWFVFTAFTLLSAYWGGHLVDRWGKRKSIALGWSIFTLSYLGFAYNTNIIFSWILLAIYGVHLGIIEPAERAYPAHLVSEEMRATAMGWYYFAYGLGALPGSFLFGILWDHLGMKYSFLINAALTLVLILLIPIVLKGDHHEATSQS